MSRKMLKVSTYGVDVKMNGGLVGLIEKMVCNPKLNEEYRVVQLEPLSKMEMAVTNGKINIVDGFDVRMVNPCAGIRESIWINMNKCTLNQE